MRSAAGERIATALTYLTISRRMNLFRHRGLAALAIGAVATSAALAVAVEVASRSVRVELVRTASALVGASDVEVIGPKRGVAEELVELVRSVPGVLEASPLIGETVRIVTSDPAGVPLHVLGVDLLAERKSFDFEVEREKAVAKVVESIEKAIKDHHEKIGVCNDTGHFLRTRIDPLDVVKAFGKQDLAGASAAWQHVIAIAPDSPEAQAAKKALDGLLGS